MRKNSSSLLVGALALILIGAGCSSTTTTSQTVTPVNTNVNEGTSTETQPVTTGDYTLGQSTGSQTKNIPGTEAGLEYQNTLVDNEIGIQVTCPGDKTWECKLDSTGKFQIQDMSANVFSLRVVTGVSSVDSALAQEEGYLKATFPGVAKDSSANGEAVFTVGPDPSWAVEVGRKAWLKIVEVNGKFIACHGVGADSNFENDSPDYVSLCNSVKAAE